MVRLLTPASLASCPMLTSPGASSMILVIALVSPVPYLGERLHSRALTPLPLAQPPRTSLPSHATPAACRPACRPACLPACLPASRQRDKPAAARAGHYRAPYVNGK